MENSVQLHGPPTLTQGNIPLYLLHMRLSGPQSLSGRYEEKLSCSYRESNSRLLGRAARSLVEMASILSITVNERIRET
jgi:hypothetical protein